MKAFLHKTGAALLAFLLLFSTLSFSVDMHFCGRSLVDMELFHKAEGCGMSMDDTSMDAMGCCSDHQIVVAGQDDLKVPPALDLQPPLDLWVPTLVSFLSDLPASGPQAPPPYEKYTPPLLIRDIPVQHQVFLI